LSPRRNSWRDLSRNVRQKNDYFKAISKINCLSELKLKIVYIFEKIHKNKFLIEYLLSPAICSFA